MTRRQTEREECVGGRQSTGPERQRPPPPSPYVARDPEAFARNFGQAIEEGGRALAAYLKPRENGQPAEAIGGRRDRGPEDAGQDRRILDRPTRPA